MTQKSTDQQDVASDFLTLREACAAIRISVDAYRTRERKGNAPFPRYSMPGSNRTLVLKADLAAYIAQATQIQRGFHPQHLLGFLSRVKEAETRICASSRTRRTDRESGAA